MENHLRQEKAEPLPYYLRRCFFAASIVLGTAATIIAVATNPAYYSRQSGVAASIATNVTANPLMAQAHLVFLALTAYFLPLGLLTMAWLAMRRAPWLASIGALLVFLGLFPLAIFAAQDASFYDIARMGSNPLLVSAAQQFNNDGIMSYYNAVFPLGILLGPMLIGIALWRAHAVPTWAAALIILSRLLVFLYPLVSSLPGIAVQLPSSMLLFIGSIPVALAVFKADVGR